ncbi:metallophosphoesterase [Pseudomonas putida]|uniref:metallophosphoesterase n=1 Tax=Pseudomonas putida TaxID=303 RepID=UPI00215A0A16|nr:metallophosphoesterase [Pseudomonas putida]
MKLHILSDLHNEFGEYVPGPAARSADVVILAGDIDVGTRGLEWANKTFNCPVIYVPGNHEFYHHHMEHMFETMRNYKSGKVTLLDMNEVIIGDVRFLGATA